MVSFPFFFPGFHFGIFLTILKASLSKRESMPLISLIFSILPVELTLNSTNTFPLIPFCLAVSGYFKFSFIYLETVLNFNI